MKCLAVGDISQNLVVWFRDGGGLLASERPGLLLPLPGLSGLLCWKLILLKNLKVITVIMYFFIFLQLQLCQRSTDCDISAKGVCKKNINKYLIRAVYIQIQINLDHYGGSRSSFNYPAPSRSNNQCIASVALRSCIFLCSAFLSFGIQFLYKFSPLFYNLRSGVPG